MRQHFERKMTVRQLWEVCRASPAVASGILATFVLGAALSPLAPFLTGRIVDALQHGNFWQSMRQLYWMAGVVLASALIALANNYLATLFRETLARDLRVQIISKIHRAKFDSALKFTAGEAINRLSGDIDAVTIQMQFTLFPTISAFLAVIVTVAFMFQLNSTLATIACCATLALSVPQHFAKRRFATFRRELSEARDRLQTKAQETLTPGALALLKGANAFNRESVRFGTHANNVRSVNLRQAMFGGWISVWSSFLQILGPVALLAFGSYLVSQRALSLGTLVAFLAYQRNLSSPFSAISNLQVQLAIMAVIFRRLFDLFDLPDETSGTHPLGVGPIEFCDVWVTRAQRPILKSLNLRIERGAHLAIVGPSGSGKSTIAAVLMRFIDGERGSVILAETPLCDILLSELRSKIALVPQDAFIFSETLDYNIRYGKPGVSQAEFDNVAELCEVNAMARLMPRGYATELGAHGFNLSGGERQRVSLARALLQRPEILILDEALTGVDLESERAILGSVRRRMKNRTLIVITHRLHSIAEFDMIVIVADGRVVVTGSHATLMRDNAWYRAMLVRDREPSTEVLSYK